MLAVERINKIKEILINQKTAKVSDLSALFNVTEETIRRDLQKLEDESFLVRSYGGAFIDEGVKTDIDISFREFSHVEGKQRIAAKCIDYIHDGNSVFLDASTTSLFIANNLANKNITLVTNSLRIANVLVDHTNINLIIIGGGFNHSDMSMLGRNAELNINSYFFDTAFISCRSLSREYGVTDSNEQQAEIRKLAIEHANKVFLVADYTKFDRTSFTRICGFDKIHNIVVDSKLSRDWSDFLKEKHIGLIECP